jgi:hypothetical protein
VAGVVNACECQSRSQQNEQHDGLPLLKSFRLHRRSAANLMSVMAMPETLPQRTSTLVSARQDAPWCGDDEIGWCSMLSHS